MVNIEQAFNQGMDEIRKLNIDVEAIKEQLKNSRWDKEKLDLLSFNIIGQSNIKLYDIKERRGRLSEASRIITRQYKLYKGITKESYKVIHWMKAVKEGMGVKHLPHDFSVFVEIVKTLRKPVVRICASLNNQNNTINNGLSSEITAFDAENFYKEYKKQKSAQKHLKKLPRKMYSLLLRFIKRRANRRVITNEIEKLREEGIKNPDKVFVTGTISATLIISLIVGLLSILAPDVPADLQSIAKSMKDFATSAPIVGILTYTIGGGFAIIFTAFNKERRALRREAKKWGQET